MTIISFIAINFGAIYRTTKSSYRDSPKYALWAALIADDWQSVSACVIDKLCV